MLLRLFETFPDAESLLAVEPEILAGPLLVFLEGSQDITPGRIISRDSIFGPLDDDRRSRLLRDRREEIRQRYPREHDDTILFALMEAWQWLENEGFVAPRPTLSPQMGGVATAYFVTRRGQTIETPEALEAYRKAKLLPKDQLHPIIAEQVWSKFLLGDYRSAVLHAFIKVEIAVREAGEYAETDYGTDLMRKAFHVENGNLTDLDQPRAEKEAISNLFAGAIGSYKNPFSHRDVEVASEEAAKMIILASHLLGIVDSRTEDEN